MPTRYLLLMPDTPLYAAALLLREMMFTMAPPCLMFVTVYAA